MTMTPSRLHTPLTAVLDQFKPADVDSWDHIWALLYAPMRRAPRGIWAIAGRAGAGIDALAATVATIHAPLRSSTITNPNHATDAAANGAGIVIIETPDHLSDDHIAAMEEHPHVVWIITAERPVPHDAVTHIHLGNPGHPISPADAKQQVADHIGPIRLELAAEVAATEPFTELSSTATADLRNSALAGF